MKKNEAATTKTKGPTPTLGLPRRENKMFTHTENKLLDQITVEIMEAWAKDLSLMKSHYKKIDQAQEKVIEASEKVEKLYEKLPKLEQFLSSNDLVVAIPLIQENIGMLRGLFGELNNSISAIWEQKVKKSDILAINTEIKSVKESIKEIEKQMKFMQKFLSDMKEESKKNWWKKLFKQDS